MPVDYVVDETLTRKDNNNLLDDDGRPNAQLTSCAEIALANVAAMLNKHTDVLSWQQLEQVVSWDKCLKKSKTWARATARDDLCVRREALRKSSEHRAFTKNHT